MHYCIFAKNSSILCPQFSISKNSIVTCCEKQAELYNRCDARGDSGQDGLVWWTRGQAEGYTRMDETRRVLTHLGGHDWDVCPTFDFQFPPASFLCHWHSTFITKQSKAPINPFTSTTGQWTKNKEYIYIYIKTHKTTHWCYIWNEQIDGWDGQLWRDGCAHITVPGPRR